MSEGGKFPWKRQKPRLKSAPPDYQRLLRPLPEPPAGLVWVYHKTPPSQDDHDEDDDRQLTEEEHNGNRVGRRRHHHHPRHRPHDSPWKLVSTLGGDVVAHVEEGTSVATTTAIDVVPATFHATAVRVDTATDGMVVPQVPAVTIDNGTPGEGDGLPLAESRTLPRASLIGSAVGLASEGRNTHPTTLPEAAAVPTTFAVGGDGKRDMFDGADASEQHGHCHQHVNDSSGRAVKHEMDDWEKVHPTFGRYQIDYTEHVVLPDQDTLAGLCLRYRIDRRTLCKVNHFNGSNDDLRLAPERLIIPITEKARRLGWKPQDRKGRDFQLAMMAAQCPSLSRMEARCYLETNDWDLDKALEEARADLAWERAEQERMRRHEEEQAKRAAALKAKPETRDLSKAPAARPSRKGYRNPHANGDDDDDDDVNVVCECLRLFFWGGGRGTVAPALELVHDRRSASDW